MTFKWRLFAILQIGMSVTASPSIAGVTYRDDFDFEERYRKPNECDPMRWHPLHLPEHCTKMYEKLMRSKIKQLPFSVQNIDEEMNYPLMYSYGNMPFITSGTETDVTIGVGNVKDDDISEAPKDEYNLEPQYNLEYEQADIYPYEQPMKSISYEYEMPQMSVKHVKPLPHEKMLRLLMKDIQKEPSAPKFEVMPNLGPVVVYNQEISKKSEDIIKKLASEYGKFGQEMYADYIGYNNKNEKPQLYYWNSKKNTTDSKKTKHKKHKDGRISRTKTKVGNLVTIIETIKPRKRQRRFAPYLLSL